MKKAGYIFCGLAVVTMMASAQDKKVQKADTKFTNYAYASAIQSYEQLVKDGYTEEEVYKNLGNANYLNANYEEASSWYGKLFSLKGADIDLEYMYRYAQTLKSLENYKESDTWMNKFKSARENDQRALVFDENRDYLEQIEERSGRYELKNIALNSKVSDFAPSFYEDGLVFSTARDSGLLSKNVHKWNNGSFLNLYKAAQDNQGNFTNVDKLSKKLNKKTHESSTAFIKDGNTMYFTRNNSDDGKFERDEDGVSRLKIYKATKENGEWNNIEELPFNGDSYSVAHPTLNNDESKLYFASDMPGTKGESDIYVVDINKDGTFSTPKNLGDRINTESRETFPFVTESDKLYFSSDGHPGLGGLDVFATDLKNERGEVFNIGRPLNGEEDDFSYIFNEETKKGFFASNRKGGQGNDDIYSFIEMTPLDFTCHTAITGIVKDQKTNALLTDASVTVYDKDNKVVSSSQTDASGVFEMEGNCSEGAYKLVATKADYEESTKTFNTEKSEDVTGIEVMLVQVDNGAPIGTDLAKYLNIEPIYFDFDKYFIREDAKISINKVLAYLNEYPNVNVQVRSHTDSRANDVYNMTLSANRAKATADYLIEAGIPSNRISYEGYGETELTNGCSDDVPCSKENHQLNRRSEFIVVE
ncbi:OmpA family protein [Maribacter stanieri]|uniref:Outer membrane protein OmpA and related peptidoglycan-associated (Lipo)proteins n=1 Tax=Maribacter stanieri TaxID=440514 RepID=A0A1I6IQ14_9FLAO|nr:OmpA family protein [Maribacter stanieri]SFR68741.1 Outer membrane protein OmpA and related peptidoglycan-associated (lipo)proteins [Maribacter stanieri]